MSSESIESGSRIFSDKNERPIVHEPYVWWGTKELMLIAAFHHSIKQDSMLSPLCCSWLMQNWEKISPETRMQIITEVRNCIEKNIVIASQYVVRWKKIADLDS